MADLRFNKILKIRSVLTSEQRIKLYGRKGKMEIIRDKNKGTKPVQEHKKPF